jgi:hypothetical protein
VSRANRAVRLLVRVSSRQPARAVLSTLSTASTLSTLLVLAAVGPLSGCSGSSEQLVVGQFFTASRLRDNTSLDNIATVIFDPRTHGTVASFSVVNISPERQTPLPLKALAQAQEDAKAEEAAFSKRKDEYQNANLEAIERVIHAEREGGQGAGTAGTAGTPVKNVKNVKNPKDADVQAAWTKWREESSAMSKKVADTRRALKSQTALADTSINGGRTAIDVTKSDGTLVTKDVTVSAPVRLPDGNTVQKTLVITLQRAILNGDKAVVGRWVVTGFKDAA